MNSTTEDKGDEPTEHPFLLSENTISGDQKGGVQSASIHGDVTLHNVFGNIEEPLIIRRKTTDEITKATQQFVAPGGFSDASRILASRSVVVLCGRGAGRSHAALRLLVDAGVTGVSEMSQRRSLGKIRGNELEPAHGYVWAADEFARKPLSEADFEHCERVMNESGCRLVIVLDHSKQSPSTAYGQTASLTPPEPLEVALSAIHRQHAEDFELPSLTLKNELHAELDSGDPPEKAVRAADLAVHVALGNLGTDRALLELREDVDAAVARWFEDWTLREYTMALSVAILEDEPYDRVVSHAQRLDQLIRTAQLPEDKSLRPRRVFDKPKEQLKIDIRSEFVVRDHPWYTGLHEETIRFVREGWAAAVLRHAWREYHSVHGILREWLSGIPENAARRALCRIATEVPAHDPLDLVNSLANEKMRARRHLAATTLERLADDHNALVRETLEHWTKYGSAYKKWTAATVYSSAFGRQNMEETLSQLSLIGKSDKKSPQDAVIGGILSILPDAEDREQVLNTVVSWSEPKNRKTGLRPVSLSLALWIAGFNTYARLAEEKITESFNGQVLILVRRLMEDHEFGPIALRRMTELSVRASWEPAAAAELIRLAQLIVPDLHWWQRRRRVDDLIATHPHREAEVRCLFRNARKQQRRSGAKQPSIWWETATAAGRALLHRLRRGQR
ncbi:hypothetical protein [Parasphingorhabdus pacifica]